MYLAPNLTAKCSRLRGAALSHALQCVIRNEVTLGPLSTAIDFLILVIQGYVPPLGISAFLCMSAAAGPHTVYRKGFRDLLAQSQKSYAPNFQRAGDGVVFGKPWCIGSDRGYNGSMV
jgi:hypothetical protein